jgi:aryl-alcohol dehydrogenase-like predicted oxidoreductase
MRNAANRAVRRPFVPRRQLTFFQLADANIVSAAPVTAVQSEYSMLWRGPEKGAIAVCEELGIGFVPWSPLGVGFLNGAIDAKTRFAPGDIRGIESRFAPENLPNNLALVELLRT